MDRIINVKVGGNHISKDGRLAGVKGEGNVTNLRISFDEGWDGFRAKEVTFWNAYGLNPVKIVLTTNLKESERVYLVPIPHEAMTEAGMFTFVIDGIDGDKTMRSMADELEVKDSPIAKDAANSVPPAPSDLQQIQGQIEGIVRDVSDAVEAILNMGVTSEGLSTDESPFVEKSVKDGVVNLHFGLPRGEKGDKGSSGVYIGSEEPTDTDINVWIDTDGEIEGGGISAHDVEPIAEDEVEVIEKAVVLTVSGWEGETSPYLQVVFVEGMTDDTDGFVFVSEGASDEQYNAAVYASLRKVAQGTDYISIKAYGERPSVDIPLTVRMVG